jgi:energy-coupling factor transporter ATP-binding protein EcfA2
MTHSRLSQGQRRRLALANALARDARVLLFDEPHARLDESSRAVLDEVVREAPAEGRTVLLASHEVELTRRVATREVRLVAGQVRAPDHSEVPA